jgi:hypothetical protein
MSLLFPSPFEEKNKGGKGIDSFFFSCLVHSNNKKKKKEKEEKKKPVRKEEKMEEISSQQQRTSSPKMDAHNTIAAHLPNIYTIEKLWQARAIRDLGTNISNIRPTPIPWYIFFIQNLKVDAERGRKFAEKVGWFLSGAKINLIQKKRLSKTSMNFWKIA